MASKLEKLVLWLDMYKISIDNYLDKLSDRIKEYYPNATFIELESEDREVTGITVTEGIDGESFLLGSRFKIYYNVDPKLASSYNIKVEEDEEGTLQSIMLKKDSKGHYVDVLVVREGETTITFSIDGAPASFESVTFNAVAQNEVLVNLGGEIGYLENGTTFFLGADEEHTYPITFNPGSLKGIMDTINYTEGTSVTFEIDENFETLTIKTDENHDEDVPMELNFVFTDESVISFSFTVRATV